MSTKRTPKRLVAWVAVSTQGHIAYYLGCHPSKTTLLGAYRRQAGRTLSKGGYRPVKMEVEVAEGSV
jgi:hypothetical protein